MCCPRASRIRHLRLLASSRTKADTIERARELIAEAAPSQPPRPATQGEATPGTEAADKPIHPCPCCGGRMIIIETFEAGSTPRHRPTASASAARLRHDAVCTSITRPGYSAVLLVDGRQRRCSPEVSIRPMQQTSKNLRSCVLDAALADHRTDATHSRRQRPLHRPPAAQSVPANSP
jgi:hypothetical protein